MKWVGSIAVALGCGSPTLAIPSNTPAAPPPDAAPAPPIDVLGTLRVAAKHWRAELEARPALPRMTAFGPCTRPDLAEQARLRTRIEAELRARWPGDEPDEPPELTFGCIDRAGAIVDVAVDTHAKATPQSAKGHWLTVRVAGSKVTTVVESTGIPSTWGAEWAISTVRSTLALADLDGDGVFDVISVEQLHEGGAVSNDLTVTTVLSSGSRFTSGTFGDSIALAAQPLVAGRAVVVVVRERDHEAGGERVIVRCLDRSGALVHDCPDAAPVHRDVALERAALRLEQLEPPIELDRAEVEELASLFELGERERTALRAATTPSPEREVARAIDRFARSERGEESLAFERRAVETAQRERVSAAALAELGEAACPAGTATPALIAKVRARVGVLEPTAFARLVATDATIKEQCELQTCAWKPLAPAEVKVTVPCEVGDKRYVLAEWRRTTRSSEVAVIRKVLLYAAGERIVPVADQGRFDMGGPWPPPFPLLGQFYRRGDAVIGIVFGDLDLDTKRVMAVVDGVIGDRRTGDVDLYEIRPLVVLRAGGAVEILHAGGKLEHVVTIDPAVSVTPAGALAALVVGHERRRAARERLQHGPELADPDQRTAMIDALTTLQAPPALIARVRAVR